MKMFVKIAWLLAIIFLPCACATGPTYGPNQSLTPPVVMEMSDIAPVSIILPKDNSLYEFQDGELKNIKFGQVIEKEYVDSVSYNGRHPYYFSGFRSVRSEGKITVFKVNGRNNNSRSSDKDRFGYISYEFKKEEIDEGDNLAITLTPVKKERSHYSAYKVDEFTKQEYMDYFTTLRLHCKIEIDSEFQPESIQANFERNFEDANYYWLTITNEPPQKFTPAYYLTYKGQKTVFSAISSSYRNGSKTIIRYDVPIVVTSATEINVSQIVAEINSKFRQVVEE